VTIVHSNESLEAHVELDGIEVRAGDQVLVHQAPVDVGFGERVECRRHATVVRGNWLDGLWARWRGAMEINELYDLSFTSRRRL
jgi:F420-0:gamma-glutamyl ligase-like protein